MSFHKLANVLAIMWTCIWTAKCWGVGEETVKAGCGSVEACQLQGVDTIIASPLKYNATQYRIWTRTAVVNVQVDVLFSLLRQRWRAGFSDKVSTNIQHDKLHGSRATVLNCITLYRCFFSNDNEQPKHVILSACQMCSQRTWPARMWCCQSLPKSINCTNRGRHTIWQQPWKTNSNYFWEKRVFTQLLLYTKKIHAVNICQCQKWQKNITEETEHVSPNQVFVYSH